MSSTKRRVDDRDQTQEALRESEARYRALVESQLDLISRYFPDTTLTFVNDAYCQFYGRTRDELVGHSFLSLVAPEFREGVLKETLASANAPRTTIGEYLNYTQDGKPCWIQWIIRGIADRKGRVVEFQAVGRDVTPMKTVEEALRQAYLVVESSPVVLFRWKAADGWPIAYVSRNVVQFGYTPGELLDGESAYVDLVHREDLDRFAEEVRQYSIGGLERFQREYRLVTKRGEIRWVEERTSVERDAEGQILHYQGIVIDITERKHAEAERESLQNQLQQAMKMEAMGRIAGGVAHDLNNVLTAITGNLELLQMDLHPDDAVLEHAREADRAARSAAALVRQLLAFTRRQIIEPRVLDLVEVIQGLRTMLSRVIGEHIVLDFVSSGDLGLVKMDPGHVEQILMNLAVNARDAMPGGGRLLVETSNAELDQDYCSRHTHMGAGPFVMMSVSDTGCGMSDDVKQHMFEPFFTTKPVGRGTGLGLATVLGIVRQMGGNIEVLSALGQGTTFEIYLPRVSEPKTSAPPAPLLGPVPVGCETILLVEDDAGVRNLAVRFLERLGYQMLVATNGHEALTLAAQWGAPIELLITDMVMPGMNGCQLAERLLAVRPLTKVLYSSGYTDDVTLHHGVIHQQLNFIGKPYSMESLGRRVRLVLDETCAPARIA